MAQGMGNSIFAGTELAQAGAACVLIHGRGQSPGAMQASVVAHLDLDGVSYVMPASAEAGWYDARAIDPITATTLAQMTGALDQIEDVLDAIATARPDLPVMLAGFSQGACLVAEMLLRRAPALGAAAILTGCRIGVATDDRPALPLGALPVYASCSDNDSWIPQDAFFGTLSALTAAGARVRADLLPGRAHAISGTEIATMRAMLADLVAARQPWTQPS